MTNVHALKTPKTANDQTRHELRAVKAGELLARDFQPRENIIAPWFRTGETALIWAGTGVGKTMLTLSLALAIAGGGRVWEWRCPKPRRVLIIDGEMHLQDVRDRLAMLLQTGSVEGVDKEALGENLSIIARQDQDPESEFFDISDSDCQRRLLRRCQAEGVEVLIIDNLTTVADGLADENDATAFRSVQEFFLRMKQAGIAAILVHHARKDGQALRGSTALSTTFEVILGLIKPKAAPHGRAAFTARFDKFRTKGNVTTEPHAWVLSDDGWHVEEDHEDVLVATIAALKTLKYATQTELAEGLGVGKGTISKRLKQAIALGLITEDGIKHFLGQTMELRMTDQEGDQIDLDVVPEDDEFAAF